MLLKEGIKAFTVELPHSPRLILHRSRQYPALDDVEGLVVAATEIFGKPISARQYISSLVNSRSRFPKDGLWMSVPTEGRDQPSCWP